MDTSKEYIKMCDCPEIQDKWDKADMKWGDFYYNDGLVLPVMNILSILDLRKEEKVVWLPRQDQLQCMVWIPAMSNYRNNQDLARAFSFWLDGNDDISHPRYIEWGDYTDSFASMEQLWLAFVMWELHNKKWDGEKWIA